MRTLVIRILALAALTTSASAADDIPDVIPADSAALYDWSGGYLGLGATYGRYADDDTLFPGFRSKGDAGNATLFAGFNYQLGSLVLGIEADYTRLDGDFSRIPAAFQSITVKDVTSLRFRAGYAFDQALFYGTVGAGYAKADVTAFTGLPAPAPATAGVELDGFGAVFGAGMDYAITDNIVLGLQYQHHIYNSFGDGNTLPGQTIDADFDVFSARISYKF